MGGALTLAAAVAAENKPTCIIPFYGIPDAKYFDLTKISVPVLGMFGALDKHTGFSDVATVEKLEESLKQSGTTYTIHIHPTQGHAYMNESEWSKEMRVKMGNPPFDQEAVDNGWKMVFEFFGKYLH